MAADIDIKAWAKNRKPEETLDWAIDEVYYQLDKWHSWEAGEVLAVLCALKEAIAALREAATYEYHKGAARAETIDACTDVISIALGTPGEHIRGPRPERFTSSDPREIAWVKAPPHVIAAHQRAVAGAWRKDAEAAWARGNHLWRHEAGKPCTEAPNIVTAAEILGTTVDDVRHHEACVCVQEAGVFM
jgi:hypothetical protein